MSQYTPFVGKEISQIAAVDLEILSTVNEGWYVEYKRDLPNQSAIAKSISALANTYGGWFFVGVDQLSKTQNVAGSCPGLPRADIDAALQKIRQSVAEHLNPAPHFEYQVVWGPNEAIQLPANYGVVCIEVNQGPRAPHVHSSGRIFRRVADSSEPIFEKDRHQLDLLWDRREKINAEYKTWIESEPERAESEKNQPYLRLLLDADLYKAKGKSWDLSGAQIIEALNDNAADLGMPFDTIHPSAQGWVARQTSSLDRHESFGLTWIIRRSLRCEVWIPINLYEEKLPIFLGRRLGRYVHCDRFVQKLVDAKSSNSRVLDLSQLLIVLVAVTHGYLRLLSKAEHLVKSFYAKSVVEGIWRTIPFLDSEIMLNRFDKFGLPLCQTSKAMLPGGFDADSFYQIYLESDPDKSQLLQYQCAFWLFELVCTTLGFEGIFADDGQDEAGKLFEELYEAFQRSRNPSKDP